MIAKVAQQCDRHAADAAARAGNQHLALARRQVVLLQSHQAEHGREARRPDAGGVLQAKSLGDGHQPTALHARELCVASPVALADAPARQHDAVALLVVWRVGFRHRPREVDAGHHWIRPHDLVATGQRQRVLIVEGGVGDLDEHVALRQIGRLERLDFGLNLPSRSVSRTPVNVSRMMLSSRSTW